MIAFVLWMVLYPVAAEITTSLAAQRRLNERRDPFSDAAHGIAGMVQCSIWLYVGMKLFALAAP
jgi:hypothetical protein